MYRTYDVQSHTSRSEKAHGTKIEKHSTYPSATHQRRRSKRLVHLNSQIQFRNPESLSIKYISRGRGR